MRAALLVGAVVVFCCCMFTEGVEQGRKVIVEKDYIREERMGYPEWPEYIQSVRMITVYRFHAVDGSYIEVDYLVWDNKQVGDEISAQSWRAK